MPNIRTRILLFVISSELLIDASAAPTASKCVLGEALLNSLLGKNSKDIDEFVAEEEAVGWSDGPVDLASNLTAAELQECLDEYKKAKSSGSASSLLPGISPEKDPSRQEYLPVTAGENVEVKGFGEHSFSYFTTYDATGHRFKQKGYVIDAAPPLATSTTTRTTSTTTTRPSKASKTREKDELKLWYNSFVSVLSKYV